MVRVGDPATIGFVTGMKQSRATHHPNPPPPNGEPTMHALITLISHVIGRITAPSAGSSWGGDKKSPGC